MAWDVEYTDQFGDWFRALDEASQEDVTGAIRRLLAYGPMLGRPFADIIKSSRHHNMKELRPMSSSIRMLFAFDPRRTAILLIGGDKAGAWDVWYERTVPIADRLYDQYLEELREEGLLS